MRSSLGITGLLLAACTASPVDAQVALGEFGDSSVTSTGLVQADANWYRSDVAALSGSPERPDGPAHALRLAVLFLKGQGPGGLDWKVGYERNSAKWLDANVRYGFAADRRSFVQVGQFKQPSGLERLSSRTSHDFMSVAMMTSAFTLGYRAGVAYGYERPYGLGDDNGNSAKWRVTASWFGRELAARDTIPDHARGHGVAMRGSWAPVNGEGRIRYFGLSYANYNTKAAAFRLRARPGAELTAIRLVDTGDMPATDRVSSLGAESFWVSGPVKLQGEYMVTSVYRVGAGSGNFKGNGGYLSGLWNITGQTWSYTDGLPVTPVGSVTGAGMWQVGLRYDAINLNDDAVPGGRMSTWTVGVNWYWSADLKFMLNYVAVNSRRAGLADNPDITGLRIQFYW